MKIRLSRWVRVLRILAVWGCPIFTVLAIMAFSIFDKIPWYANAIIICVFLFVYWSWQSSFASLFWAVFFTRQVTVRKEFYESLLDGDDIQGDEPLSLKRHLNAKATLFSLVIRQGIPLFIGFCLLFGVCWFFSGGCVALEPVSISFKGMRALSSEVCNSGLKPCLVYLTAAGNTSSSVFVVFHTNYRMKSPSVRFSTSKQASPLDYELTALVDYIEMDLEVTRFVYMAYLSHLEQKPIYFVAGDGQIVESYSAERSFLPTVSSLSHGPLRIISTGDVGLTDLSSKMLAAAAARDPSLFLFGGDLAYANGMKACYRRWDRWLRMYSEKAISPAGHSIPVMTSIGNHEAGGFHLFRTSVPFYINYFFHQGFNTDHQANLTRHSRTNRAPNGADSATKSRPSNIPNNVYHSHDLAGTSLIVLDSNVLTSPSGEQSDWLDSTLNSTRNSSHPSAWTYALYHAPMYPAVRSVTAGPPVMLQESWGKIFSKHQLDIAFENHDHAYKRTHPLKYGKVVHYPEKGTIYLGDGALGVRSRRPAPASSRPYLAASENANFYFDVTFTKTNVSVLAVDERGVIFDSYIIHK